MADLDQVPTIDALDLLLDQQGLAALQPDMLRASDYLFAAADDASDRGGRP